MMGVLTISALLGALIAVVGFAATGNEFSGLQSTLFLCTAAICRAIERTGTRKDHDNERD